jgi:hypothetical protein
MSSQDLILSRPLSGFSNPLVTTTIILLMFCIEMMIVLLSSHLENENVELDTSKLLLTVSSVASSVQLLELNRRSQIKMLVLLKFSAMCRTRTHVLSSALLGRAEDITPWMRLSAHSLLLLLSFFLLLLLILFLSNCFVYICLFILILLRFL